MALPSLVAVLMACVWVLAAMAAQSRCADAARAGARAASRGDTDVAVRAWIRKIAPGASATIIRSGDAVRVEVHSALRPARLMGDLAPALTVSASVVGPAEPMAAVPTGG